jgi:hypothetical protein
LAVAKRVEMEALAYDQETKEMVLALAAEQAGKGVQSFRRMTQKRLN